MVSVISREAATEANASTFSLEPLGTCSSFQSEKQFKHCFTRDTYFSIRGSRESNSSLTFPSTNYESLRMKSLLADTTVASSSPARMASYSDSLLEALNPSCIEYLILSPDRVLNFKPMPATDCLEASSILRVHQSELSRHVYDWGSSAMKSTSTCPFFESLGLYWIPYSLSSTAHRAILLYKSGLCIVLRRGRLVNTTMGCAWK